MRKGLVGKNFKWTCKSASMNVYLAVVYDRNQVSVWGTETKVHFQYWYRSRIFFSETETSDFSMFQTSFGDISFYKLQTLSKYI